MHHLQKINTFGWVYRQERGHQSGAAVLVTRAARDGGSLGAERSFRGWEVSHLYMGESRVCFGIYTWPVK
jgi:hypothetical protein